MDNHIFVDEPGALRLIDSVELAKRLGTRPATISKWAREGLIPCFRANQKTVRFDPEAVLAVLAQQKGGAA